MRQPIRIIVLFTFVVAVAAICWLLTVRSVGAAQGKGGAVIAKPPAASKKTTAKKTPGRKADSGKNDVAPTPSPTPTPAPVCSAQSPTQGTGRQHTTTLPGRVKMDLVEIPTGSFCMGAGVNEVQISGDPLKSLRPVHLVTFRYVFYVGRYEVTQEQWKALMGTTVRDLRNPGDKPGAEGYWGEGDTVPMYNLSWNDVQQFVEKLNEMNDGYIYRLPSESEWEYACRAGTTTAFAFGDSLDSSQANFNGGYPFGGAPPGPYRYKAIPVGSFPPNTFGLYDMHGNIEEWCQDVSHDTYDGAPNDGSPWMTGGDQTRRMLRGGGWGGPGSNLRSAERQQVTNWMNTRQIWQGFRIAAVRRT